jgi:hypothetical protein
MITHIPSLRFIAVTLALCSVLGIAACTTPSPKMLSVQDILRNANQAPLKDAIFTENLTLKTSRGTLSMTGNGKLTTQPKRTDTTVSITIAGKPILDETITDGQDIYRKVANQPKWNKSSLNKVGFAPSSDFLALDYDQMKGGTLIGSESINGVTTWHLSSMGPSHGSSTGSAVLTENLWLRQDNYYPVKITLHEVREVPDSITNAQQLYDETIIFTQWDKGIIISLPASSEVIGG